MVPIHIFKFLSELWPLCVTLTLVAGIWILHATLSLTMVNICAKLYWKPPMNVEVLLRTSVFQWALSVTLTFDLETWIMHGAIHIMVVNISIKYYKNSSIHVGDMLQTKSGYFTIFSDLDLAYIDLKYMCHSRSHYNDHLCYNPSINDD